MCASATLADVKWRAERDVRGCAWQSSAHVRLRMSCSRCSCVESSLVPWPTLPTSGEAKSKDSATDPSCRAAAVDALEPIVGLTSRADWASSSAICASISSVRAATSRDQFTEPETERRDGDSGVDAAISLGCFVARSLTYK